MQRACDFIDAGCCARGSGLAGTFLTGRRKTIKSTSAVCEMLDLPEKLSSEPSL